MSEHRMRQDLPPGRKLGYYERGATPFVACRGDPRVSYCLYVPPDYDEDGEEPYDLVVLMHGTGRTATAYRDRFADFARERRCILLAPLFPAGLVEPGELSNYKLIEYQGLRFDHLLLSMIEEVAARYRLRGGRFLLFGFSGGGHFAHRFLYLHPERLLGVSIGAPGVVTLLDPTRDWWVGVRDLEARFGKPLDLAAMRRVPVQLVIGGEDKETWEITIQPGDSWWMPEANRAGRTRLDRIAALRDSLAAAGLATRLDIVPGIGHQGPKVLEPVRQFFAECLAQPRKEEGKA